MIFSKKKFILALLVVFVVAFLVGSGVALFRSRVSVSKLSPEKVLVEEGKEIQVTGKAFCGFCFWKIGEAPHNIILKREEDPKYLFLLKNKKLEELEGITGKCAAGDIEVTAKGKVTEYKGRNYLLLSEFSYKLLEKEAPKGSKGSHRNSY